MRETIDWPTALVLVALFASQAAIVVALIWRGRGRR